MSMDTGSATPNTTAAGAGDDLDFELDVSIVDSGPVVPELLRSTSDNCGQTCQTACTSCKS
jgi:FxLD family lantipeptide